MSHPAAKRPRTDHDEDGQQPTEEKVSTGIRDKEAWFPDGNIDIVAEGIAFRVHRTVLSAQSEVFRVMLSIPQPAATGDDGDFPVVKVTDSADDMRHLLLVLYYRDESFRPQQKARFGVVSRLVRLAHKYEIQSVLDDAMGRIRVFYPSNLEDFLKVLKAPPSSPTLEHKNTDCFEVVQLARLIGDNSLLPAAFYRCCQLKPGPSSANNRTRLSDEDMERCMAGRAYLANISMLVKRAVLQDGKTEDCFQDTCDDGLTRMTEGIESLMMIQYSDTRCNALTCMEIDEYDEVLCGWCIASYKRRLLEVQKDIWNTLPERYILNLK
ncbi:uncharacterized protein B0H18DRAFT_987449 [Fomitopsis serialis]|uniref:uncharacterized protein n=1 Tax=Fomitopsis serialis TaxID=139415 RepID=UPI002007F452|nr:uncharacterized protein B0H18DRAFT_987449 [Neoantrodia serialis]KAH9932292.1 hypothetical protein B0H18DRAFT_987449 [Neoantrodia serialis]